MRLFVLTMAHIVGTVGYLAVAAMAPVITRDLSISATQFGFLMSSFYAAQTLLSLPSGALTDRLGVGWSLALSMGFLTAAAAIFAYDGTYTGGLTGMFLFGIGYSLVNPATARGVMHWFTERRRGTAMGFKQLGVPVGGMFAAACGALVVVYDWRLILACLAGVSALTATVCIAIANPPNFSRGNSAWHDLKTVLTHRSLAVLNSAIVTFNIAQTSFFTYLTLFLRETAQVSQPTAALCLAWAQGSGAAGRVGFSFLSDTLFSGRRKRVIVPLLIGSVISMIAASFVTPGWPTLALIGLSIAMGLTVATYAAIILTVTVETVDRSIAGSAIGYGSLAWSIGGTIGPPLFGYVLDQTGRYGDAWLAVAAIMTVGLLWFGLGFKERGRSAS